MYYQIKGIYEKVLRYRFKCVTYLKYNFKFCGISLNVNISCITPPVFLQNFGHSCLLNIILEFLNGSPPNYEMTKRLDFYFFLKRNPWLAYMRSGGSLQTKSLLPLTLNHRGSSIHFMSHIIYNTLNVHFRFELLLYL